MHGRGEREVIKVLVGKTDGKRPLGRPRRRWDQNGSQIGWGVVEWIQVAQNRDRWRTLVNTVMNFWVLALRSK
jgi:hypothetical protein